MDIFFSGYTLTFINHSSHVFLRCKLSNSLPPLFIQYFVLRLLVYCPKRQLTKSSVADIQFIIQVYAPGSPRMTVTLTASESALALLRSST